MAPRTATTDERGVATFGDPHQVRFDPGNLTIDVDVVASGGLRGRLTAAEPAPLPGFSARLAAGLSGARVVATFPGAAQPYWSWVGTRIDAGVAADGSFEFTGLPAGSWQLDLVAHDDLRVLAQLPKGVEQSLLRARVASDGRHVAWATPWNAGVPDTPGFVRGAALIVVDAASGETVRAWDGIEVAISPFSSSMATLEFTWLDAKTLRYGDTQLATGSDGQASRHAGTFRWVDVALDRREVIAAWPLGPMELSHDLPSTEREPILAAGVTGAAAGDALAASGRRACGWFERDGMRL